jgi:hypothetical protein
MISFEIQIFNCQLSGKFTTFPFEVLIKTLICIISHKKALEKKILQGKQYRRELGQERKLVEDMSTYLCLVCIWGLSNIVR